MKVPSVLKNLLTNRIVLNIVSVLAIFNMIGYLISGNITPVLFFIVLAILITHFSRNMIIVLGIPLILVNLFVMKASSIEGMETNTSSNNTSSNNSSSSNSNSTGVVTIVIVIVIVIILVIVIVIIVIVILLE